MQYSMNGSVNLFLDVIELPIFTLALTTLLGENTKVPDEPTHANEKQNCK